MSSFTSEVWKRSVGVIGLYVLIAIVCFLKSLEIGSHLFRSLTFLRSSNSTPIIPATYFDYPAHNLQKLVVGHVLRQLLTGLQANIRLLPVRLESGELAPAALLAEHVGSANIEHLHLEERLDCLLHFGLGRLGSHIEYQRPLGLLHLQTLFGNQRAADNFIECRHYATSF